MPDSATCQTREFQAETKQLLDLMVHSIYTNREIFLRELISNASDAIDKIRFESLTNRELLEGDSQFEIYIVPDEDAHTLTISDNGTGMTYDEVVANIGTIAKSGTRTFLEKMRDAGASKDDLDLIGQFGVGFYSAFMVSDKVTLITRAPGQKMGVQWESTGDGTYTIEEIEQEKRGTTIILSINQESRDAENPDENFLNQDTLQNMVKKYSDYVRYPIRMDFIKEERPVDADGKIIEGAPNQKTREVRTLNSMTPLWVRQKNEITTEDYHQFYKNMFHDWNEPIDIIHSKAEGMVEYTSLLFIPSHAPYDFYTREFHQGIKLYSRNVFVMDNCEDLLPEYLRFVRGLVDSADFSLNISREILQNSKALKLIGKNLEKSILKALEAILNKDRKKYEGFWIEFGKAIKSGVYLDFSAREKLQDLLLFPSSQLSEGQVTLAEYVGRMPEGQTEIYYATGTDRATVEKQPQMEILKEKGYEVLYLFDRVDEFAIDSLRQYKEKHFRAISRGDLKLDGKDVVAEKASEELSKETEPLLKAIQDQLQGKVSAVRLSSRLKSSAVCLVSGDTGISLSMEQILSEVEQPFMKATRILELNPEHPVFKTLQNIYNANSNSQKIKDYAEVLYGQALLMEGIKLDDPVAFANKVAELIVSAEK